MKINIGTHTNLHGPHSTSSRSGFIISVEMLFICVILVIGIIGGLAALRESSARIRCQNHLQQMATVLLEEHQQTGQFPAQIPEDWKVQDGYLYQIGRRSDQEIEIVAKPGAPGRTGLEELRLVASGDGNSRIEFQLAEGAIEGRRKMFVDLGKAGAACTKNLLRVASQSGRSRIEGLLRADFSGLNTKGGPVPELVAQLDTDGDGLLTVSEIFVGSSDPKVHLRAGPVDPASAALVEFLKQAREIMAIGQFGEDPEALPAVIVDHLLEPSNLVLSHIWTQRVLPYMVQESAFPSAVTAPARR